ncbi:hypothetical protein Nepgr_002828 [Nepenthes gracilis]|uniref:Uncharacterized protein n=1 Tax=Nepenthes gracilis TaxID=150966 RepID=A0AAD3P716_NEPGR|nr:hypothetical protein Nepgr_002828 [Nepenthes gracilis]
MAEAGARQHWFGEERERTPRALLPQEEPRESAGRASSASSKLADFRWPDLMQAHSASKHYSTNLDQQHQHQQADFGYSRI